MGSDKNRESWGREIKQMGGGIFAKSFIPTPIFKTLGRELIDSELVESRKKNGNFCEYVVVWYCYFWWCFVNNTLQLSNNDIKIYYNNHPLPIFNITAPTHTLEQLGFTTHYYSTNLQPCNFTHVATAMALSSTPLYPKLWEKGCGGKPFLWRKGFPPQ